MGDKLKSSWRRRRRTCLLGRDGVLHEGKPAVPPPSLPGRGRCHAAAFSLTLSRAPTRRTEDGGERSEARGRGDGLAASPCSSRLRRSGARSARTPPPHCRSRKSRYSSRLCAPLCARSDRPTDRPTGRPTDHASKLCCLVGRPAGRVVGRPVGRSVGRSVVCFCISYLNAVSW